MLLHLGAGELAECVRNLPLTRIAAVKVKRRLAAPCPALPARRSFLGEAPRRAVLAPATMPAHTRNCNGARAALGGERPVCQSMPAQYGCDQIQTMFMFLLLAIAFIFVALVIYRCTKVGVKQTFATLAAGLWPRRHRRQQGADAGSAESGIAQWQVRVELRTHRGTVALAERLSAAGEPIARRWKSLVARADDEDDAHRLLDTIRLYTAADAVVHVERTAPIHARAALRRSQRP